MADPEVTEELTFPAVAVECLANRELVREFNRLSGTHLLEGNKRAPIEKMIDEATGYQKVLDEREYEEMK